MLKPFSLEVRVRRWNAEKSKSVRGKFENTKQKKTEQNKQAETGKETGAELLEQGHINPDGLIYGLICP